MPRWWARVAAFWLCWADARGRRVSHAPDFFGRRADVSAVVVDWRPVEGRRPFKRLQKPTPTPLIGRTASRTQRT